MTAMFYASINAGLMLGPAIAGGLLLVTTAPVVLVLNALSFVGSAVLLGGVDLGPRPATAGDAGNEGDARAGESGPGAGESRHGSVWADTRAGTQAALALPGVPVLMGVGALVVLTGAMFNVLAPLLATGPLHAGGSGYSLLMALYGLGMVAGSWANARAGSDIHGLRRRWLVGIAVSGIAMAGAALAPNLGLALVAFTLIGLGENLLVGPEMRLMQEMVSERLLGRAFGLKDVLENLAFVSAFLGAGALLSLAGVRTVFVGAGLVTVALSLVGAVAFRTRRIVGQPTRQPAGQPALGTGE